MKKIINIFFANVIIACSSVVSLMNIISVSKETEVNAISTQSSDLIIKSFDSSNGLSASQANSVLATKKGYLWVGSYNGLFRYDGKSFYNFSKNEFGLSGVTYLFEDDNELIYIGTNDKGLYTYDGFEFNEIKVNEDTSVPFVRHIVKDSHNKIYLGCKDGVYYIDNGKAVYLTESQPYDTVYGLAVDGNDTVWGCANDGSLFGLYDNKEIFHKSPSEIGLVDKSIYSTYAKGNDVYLGIASNFVRKISFPNYTYEYSSENAKDLETTGVAVVNRMTIDDNNNLWVATKYGCGYFDKDENFFTDDELKQISKTNDVSIDHQGNVWFASQSSGVYQVINSSFFHLTDESTVQGKSLNTVTFHDGYYFIGTDTGVIMTDTNFNKVVPTTNPTVFDQFDGYVIKNIFIDSDGSLWISSEAPNCFAKVSSDLSSVTPVTSLCSVDYQYQLRQSIQLRNNNIAVATGKGLFIFDKACNLVTSYPKDKFGDSVILNLCEISSDELLVATDGGGLYKLVSGEVSKIKTEDEKSLGVVLRIYNDNEFVWVADSSSLYMYKDNVLRQVMINTVATGSILDIFSSGNNLYLLENDGIYLISRSDAIYNTVREYIHFGANHGLIGNITANSYSLLKDSKLYICTNKGLSYISLGAIENQVAKAKIYVSEISYEIDETTHIVDLNKEEIEIDCNAINLRIKLNCFNFGLDDCPTYYLLKGFDKSVNKIVEKGETEIVYSSLSGGSYELVVYTMDKDNVVDNQLSIKLYKNLHWYEKPVYIVLMCVFGFLFLAGIGFLVAFLRIKKSEKEKLKYKEITNEAMVTIANTIDAKDEYTKGHSVRVSEYSLKIGERVGLKKEELEQLRYIALLHDIGKIGVSDAVLKKPDKLTDEEYAEIKKHTVIGGKILSDFKMVDHIADGAIGHHERYDGKGYPNGKVGDENPLIARIISVADTYDAMSSTRPYRTTRSPEFCIEQLEKGKGTQFDPELAQIMIDIIKEENKKPEDK